jgi:hypothetical protein
MTGGTVGGDAETAAGILNEAAGTLNISGGTVSTEMLDGNAVINYGDLTVSDTAVISAPTSAFMPAAARIPAF